VALWDYLQIMSLHVRHSVSASAKDENREHVIGSHEIGSSSERLGIDHERWQIVWEGCNRVRSGTKDGSLKIEGRDWLADHFRTQNTCAGDRSNAIRDTRRRRAPGLISPTLLRVR
jgi:hypothetical protein